MDSKAATNTHIESRQGVCGGKPCVAGTRIRVQDVYVWHEVQGMSADEIVQAYPQLTLADVHAALTYYFDHQAEIQRDMRMAEELVERMKAEGGPGVLDRLAPGGPAMIRLHLDEHVSPIVAAALRGRGLDVTTTADAQLIGAEDLAHIAFALAQDRVIVTHDDDFLVLHSHHVEHSGIVYCHQNKYSLRGFIGALLLLSSCSDPEELRGRVEFL